MCVVDSFLSDALNCSLPSSMSMELFRQEYWSGLHFLLQRITPTQGSNPSLLCLLCLRQILYPLSHQGSPKTQKLWVQKRFTRTLGSQDETRKEDLIWVDRVRGGHFSFPPSVNTSFFCVVLWVIACPLVCFYTCYYMLLLFKLYC